VQEITVTCGCGRKMRVDTLRGKGAYRCGCGVRVQAETPKANPLCVGVVEDKSQCGFVVVAASRDHGLALCGKHLERHEEYLRRQAKLDAWEANDLKASRQHHIDERTRVQKRLDSAREEGRMVVYYVRIGSYIKIGTTTSFKYRMTSLMPDEILATEPGHEELERLRHKQFAHLRIPLGRERFRADPELTNHIQMIREHYGEPTDRYPSHAVKTDAPTGQRVPLGVSPGDLL